MKYKVGDKVRVKNWDDMVREYGLDTDGDIKTRVYFVEDMKYFCGKICTIAEAECGIYSIEGDSSRWAFTDEMFEGYATKFKVGDRVKVINVTDHRKSYVGEVFTIKRINPNGEACYNETPYGVSGDCHYIFFESELELYGEEKIVITTDGKKTVAKLYKGEKVVKSAIARCNPADEFDFDTGAKIAFDRLFGREDGGKTIDLPDIDFTDLKRAVEVASAVAKNILETIRGQKWRVVDRPAKAGDYIRLKKSGWNFKFNRKGDILRVCKTGSCLVYVLGKDHPRQEDIPNFNEIEWAYCKEEYEVVEPVESEEKPKCYKGKAVCIESSISGITAGIVYDFSINDGCGRADDGMKILSVPRKSIEEINKAFNDEICYAKFMQFEEYNKQFEHHLEDDHGSYYGKIGDPSNYEDAIGRPLFIGDTVELYDSENDFRGEFAVVRAKLTFRLDIEKSFVMGIESCCDEESGKIEGFKIIKKRSFEDIKDGEEVGDIIYRKPKLSN